MEWEWCHISPFFPIALLSLQVIYLSVYLTILYVGEYIYVCLYLFTYVYKSSLMLDKYFTFYENNKRD